MIVVLLVASTIVSCKRGYDREDLIGVWRVEKMTGVSDADFDRTVWIMEFDDDGTHRNYIFDLDRDFDDQDAVLDAGSLLMSGEWSLNDGIIEVETPLGAEDVTIEIESLDDEEFVMRHGTMKETLTCRRFADDMEDAAMKMAAMKVKRRKSRF